MIFLILFLKKEVTSFFTVSNLSNMYSICSFTTIFLHDFVYTIYQGMKEFINIAQDWMIYHRNYELLKEQVYHNMQMRFLNIQNLKIFVGRYFDQSIHRSAGSIRLSIPKYVDLPVHHIVDFRLAKTCKN